MEEIKELNALMSSTDWRDRYKAITQLLEMCEINENLVATNVVKVLTLDMKPEILRHLLLLLRWF